MKHHIRNISVIIIGTGIMAFGVNYFNIANRLSEGGVTGITILLKYMFDWDPGITNFVINIPLLMIGWKVLGRNTLFYTIVGTIAVSIFLSLFEPFRHPMEDTLLAALYAGITVGIGLGLVFWAGGTTGGVDIIARLGQKYKGWSIGRTMFAFDVVVITFSLFYLNLELAMYTLVAVFVSSRVVDFVQEGSYSGKAVFVISDLNREISGKITKEMGRGTTLLQAQGGYTDLNREVLYCVIGRNQLVRVKNLVHQMDPHAFLIVNDVHEVFGEGFTFERDSSKQH